MALPAQPGPVLSARARVLSWLLLAMMFAGPFVRSTATRCCMINIVDAQVCPSWARFSGRRTWSCLRWRLLLFITGIIIFTAAYGRLWCGWVCPQTLLMEMVFRRIEYLIEGDSRQQRALDRRALDARAKLAKKVTKQPSFSACRSSSATRC